jgi:ABC-type branched-subunit amino acid transport system ATPase component
MGHPLGSLFSALATNRDRRAGLLSGGQRQMLSIEMASQHCGLVGLWDEPTAGLSQDKAELVLDHILRLAGPYKAHLIVEQREELLVKKVARTLWMDELIVQGQRTCLNDISQSPF